MPEPGATPRRTWILAALWLGLAVALVVLHAESIDLGPRQIRILERHDAILAGDGDAPWTYRLAVPFVVETVRPLLERVLGLRPADAVTGAYLAARGLTLFATFLLFHRWLSRRLDWPWPLAGTLLLAALSGPATVFYWFAPDSPVDLAIWAAALVLTEERRFGWLVPLVLLGALNRETAVFAVGLHVALRWGREPAGRLVLRSAGLLAAWAGVLALVRVAVGTRPWAHGGTPLGFLTTNLTEPAWLAWAAVFLGVLWIAPALAGPRLPPDLRRAAAVLVPYVLLILLFGRVREVRLLLPAVLVLIPILLVALGARPLEARRSPEP